MGCMAQRSPYAGKRPIGYPVIEISTANSLGDRFGDDAVSTTTVKLPVEALGDAELVRRMSKLPIDQQPFWLINWRALEAQRQNPQSFPLKPNTFIDGMMFQR
ncbi:unnamed protein product [Arctia plantaginis]|uniref:Uncharacterized protein n=1 Tax=Arctia plantaginis TaxID=874455 RepID=A0A8S0ZJA1_ARCPL|nr:unnamed protein product [Arctia plantaginis]